MTSQTINSVLNWKQRLKKTLFGQRYCMYYSEIHDRWFCLTYVETHDGICWIQGPSSDEYAAIDKKDYDKKRVRFYD